MRNGFSIVLWEDIRTLWDFILIRLIVLGG